MVDITAPKVICDDGVTCKIGDKVRVFTVSRDDIGSLRHERTYHLIGIDYTNKMLCFDGIWVSARLLKSLERL